MWETLLLPSRKQRNKQTKQTNFIYFQSIFNLVLDVRLDDLGVAQLRPLVVTDTEGEEECRVELGELDPTLLALEQLPQVLAVDHLRENVIRDKFEKNVNLSPCFPGGSQQSS